MTICVSRDGEQARRSVILYSAHYLSLGGAKESLLPDGQFRRISELAAQATGWYFEPDVSYPAELDTIVGPEIIDRFLSPERPPSVCPSWKSCAAWGFAA